jgi:uncharacterized protein (DUF4415 family)
MEHKRKLRPVLAPHSAEEEAAINRGIAEDPDNPEWTDADFARAKPVWAFPELVAVLQHPDVLTALKADGKGWQTRANAALRKALGL